MRRGGPVSPLTLLAFVLALGVALKNAWVGEDAYIVFRSIDQLAAGHGPIWNPHERVQVFTSPLWYGVLALLRPLTPDLYPAAVAIGLAAWSATLVVLRRVAGAPTRFLFTVLVLVVANAVMDYTTSGLETSLLFLLLVAYVRAWQGTVASDGVERGRALLRMGALAGLVLLTRADHLFLVAPPLVSAMAEQRRREGRLAFPVVAAAVGPVLAWSLFALVYYGFPLPNTAYAKLDTGVAGFALARQGVRYLLHTAGWDAVLAVVAAGWAWWGWRRRETRPWLVGFALQSAWVVRVGGDFMQGRFLAAVFVTAVAVGVGTAGAGLVRRRALWVGLVVYGLLFPHTPLNTDPREGTDTIRLGIADERAVYAEALSVWRWAGARRAGAPFPDLAWRREGEELRAAGRTVTVAPNIGVLGWAAGTEPIIIDPMALSDPFLARRPCRGEWRIGHFPRDVPRAYLASLSPDAGAAVGWPDADARALAADMALITRGPLFAADRWQAILRRNLP